MTDSGQLIHKLREDRFLKSRDVERQSRAIADRKRNDDYYIGHAHPVGRGEWNHSGNLQN
jgi:hypothetical protein